MKIKHIKINNIGPYVNDNCFEFDINKVFASHILIVGNTGSGKSNTLAKLYESLFSIEQLNFKKSKFLVIDTNGEFEKSFSENDDLKKIIDVGDESNGLKFDENGVVISE